MIDDKIEKTETEKNLNASNDWFLETLINVVNSNDAIGLPITLTVQGSIISGNLISGVKYFELFGIDFAKGFEAPNEKLTKLFSDLGEKTRINIEEKKTPPSYIHLSGAKYYHTDGSSTPTNGMLWRGQISEVSGFSYGKFEPSK